jgi:hypothetical protein
MFFSVTRIELAIIVNPTEQDGRFVKFAESQIMIFLLKFNWPFLLEKILNFLDLFTIGMVDPIW